MKGRFAPVRWREDTGWELRCDRCASLGKECYWPLTFDFWTPGRMKRCNACERDTRAAEKRARYHNDPAYRQRKIEANRRNRPADERLSDRLRYQEFKARLAADPVLREAHRERQRAAQRAYRRRIRIARWSSEHAA